MENKIKNLPNSEVEIEMEISPEELDNFIEKAFLSLSGNLEIKGFRKGQAPKDVVRSYVGENAVMTEASEMAINENYRKVIAENKIEVIGRPNVEILKLAKGNPFVCKIKVQTLPKIELPDYKKIAEGVKIEESKVEEKEVQEVLNWLQKTRAKNTLKNGTAEKGDFVEIEHQINSPEIPGVGASAVKLQNDGFILGEGHFLPGFEEAIIGMKSGEEKKDIELQVPADFFQKEIAGKKVKVEIKVKSIQTVELPEINDEFAKGAGKFDNLEMLKKNISDGIQMEKEQALAERVKAEILEKIGRETKIALPQILVEQEKNRMLEGLRREVAERLKIPFDQYLARIQKTEKEIEESFEKEAENNVRNFLIMKEIGEKENITATRQEIEDEMNKFLSRYSDIKEAEKEIDLPSLRIYMEEAIRNRKIMEMLLNLTKK